MMRARVVAQVNSDLLIADRSWPLLSFACLLLLLHWVNKVVGPALYVILLHVIP